MADILYHNVLKAIACHNITKYIINPDDIRIFKTSFDSNNTLQPGIYFTEKLRKTAADNASRPALHVNGKLYTYQEFYQTVFSLAALFRKCDPVGIIDNRDMLSNAAVVAAILTGKTYVPIHPSYPEERKKLMIRECGMKFIFDSTGSYKENSVSTLLPEQILLANKQDADFSSVIKAGSIAYILFTSGSTGEPKGVPVSYGNLQHFFNYFLNEKRFDFNPNDRFLQMYDLTFDVSVFSLMVPLLSGACVYITPKNKPAYLSIAETLEKHQVTVSSMVPSVLNFLKPYFHELKFPSLRYSFFSGDILWHDLAMQWSEVIPGAEIHNFYGPTETTIVCTHHPWKKTEEKPANGIVPIGKPFPGMDYLIMNDKNGGLDKHGSGELCLGGPQVIDSYLGDKHSEKFIFITVNSVSKKYYKTGDRVSAGENGKLFFHGRTDRQVKVNGYRVELAEIEHYITQFTNGKLNAVIGSKENGIDVLLAYVENFRNLNGLKSYLQKNLPEYMLPKKILSVNKIPLNGNGKINYTALENTTHSLSL